MLLDLFQVAIRNLRRRRTRSYLTMIGIFIGIASVVALIGLGEGLRMAIIGQFGLLGADALSVQASGLSSAGPPGTATANPLSSDLVGEIRKVDGVDAAFNRYISIGTLEFNDKQNIGFAASIPDDPERKALERMINLKVEEGRMLKDGDGRRVVLGANFAEDNNGYGEPMKVGDKVMVNDLKFEVVGILEKKGSFILDGSVLINEDTLIDDLGADKDNVNIIAVRVKDVDQINKVKADIEKLMRKERDVKEGEEDFSVDSPQQTVEALGDTLFAVQLFVYIIAVVSIIVGGIGVSNTMYTAVLERTKEIGILKSIGATNNAVFLIFFLEAGLLGLVGGLIGVVLGSSLAYGLAAAGASALGSDLIQAHITPLLIGFALAFSMIVGLLAGVIPAYQASRKNPVDCFRATK